MPLSMKKELLLFLACIGMLASTHAQNVNPRGFAPDGTIFTMKRKGNILYVGGGFNKVGIHTGGAAIFGKGERLPDVEQAYIFGEVHVSMPDGQGGWFMGGDFNKVNNTTVSNLVHILPDNSVDQNFIPIVDGPVEALAIFNDTMMFGGNFLQVNGQSRSYLASWDLNSGTLTSWDPQPNGRIYALKEDNGFVYAGGAFSRIGSFDQVGLAKIDIQTGESVQFPSPGSGTVFDLDIEQDKLYSVGNFTGLSGFFTGRTAEVQVGNNTPFYNFPATDGTIEQIIPDGNGGWFVAGSFFNIGGVNQKRLAHVLPNNQVDPNFTPDISGTVNAMAVFNDTMMFGGTFRTVDGVSRERLASYDMSNNVLTPWNPTANGTVRSLQIAGDHVFVGGTFTYIDSMYSPVLARLDRITGDASQIQTPISGEVKSMAVSGNTLYAGGSFNGAVGFPTGRLARLTAEDSLPPWPFAEFNGNVEVIVPDGNGGWYVGGSFFRVNDVNQRRLAHILPDNSLDPNFNLNPNNTVSAIQVFNDTMMIAGNFTQIAGQTRNRVAAYDLGTGTLLPFNPNVNSQVYDMGIFNDTMMLVGAFTTVGGQTRERLAMFNISTGTLLPFSMPINNIVRTLAWNDTMMFIGGQFTSVAGQTRNRMARIARGSGTLSPVSYNVNNLIHDIEIVDNTLYFSGAFTSVDGQARGRLASINLNTQALTTWNPNADNQVYDMLAWNDTMMIAGNFTTIGGQNQLRLAKVNRFSGNTYNWKADPNNAVFTLARNGNQILAGGSFSAVHTDTRSRMLAMDLTDFQRRSFAPNFNSTIEEIRIFNDTMMVVGAFTQVNGQPRKRLASIHRTTAALGPLNMDIDNTVFSLLAWNDTMMLAGRFDEIDGVAISNLAAIQPSTNSLYSWNPRPGNHVNTLARQGRRTIAGGSFTNFQAKTRNRGLAIDLFNDTMLLWNPDLKGFFGAQGNCLYLDSSFVFIGGRFTGLGDSTATNLGAVDKISGLATGKHIAISDEVWDVTVVGDSLLFVGEFREVDTLSRSYGASVNKHSFQLTDWKPELEDDGLVLEKDGGKIMVGGNFSMTNRALRKSGYAINLKTNELLPWDPDPNNIITDIETDRTGSKVYVAGGFTSIAGEPISYFAALDPINGSSIPGWDFGITRAVRDIAIDPKTDAVYIGGAFTSVGGQTRNRLAGIDRAGNLLPFAPNVDDEVRSIAWNDTMMFISGSFNQVNGQTRNNIASLTPRGQLRDWEPSHDTPFFSVMGEVVAAPGKIFLQGSFGEINGKARNRIAAVGPQTARLDYWNPRLARGTSPFSVNVIYPIGNDVFVGGTFNSVRGTSVDGLARIDIETGVIQPPIVPFGFNSINAFESYDNQLFFGGDYDSVANRYQPNLSSLSFEPSRFTRKISEVAPKQGGNTGDITLRIRGFGFRPGARVILRKAGFADIISQDSSVVLTSGRQIEASFILRGEPVGIRDVYVEIPGDTTFFLADAFEIVAGEEPMVWVDMVGPSTVRNRFQNRYFVNYGNTSNMDAVGVPVWMVLPRNFVVESYSVRVARPRDSAQAIFNRVPRFFDVDSVGGEALSGRLYTFIIPKIAANSSGQFSFRFRANGTGPFQYKIWVTKPLFGSPLKQLAGECIDETLTDLVGLLPGGGCARATMEATFLPMLNYADPESGFGSGDYIIDFAGGLAETVATCAQDTTGLGGIVEDILKTLVTTKNSRKLTAKCSDQYDEEDEDGGHGMIISSVDPNEKIGLPGNGEKGWLNSNQVFSYLINYENVDTASAAAQIVTIHDTLDTQVFDLSTLQLGFFSIADSVFPIPQGRKEYETVVDLRPRIPLYVKMEAKLDMSSGALNWRFSSIDTLTLKPTNDPILGYLPPNVDSIGGTGAVFYTVRTHPNLPSGTQILNKADIVFDFNDPIITDTWINTADNDIPSSQIEALPPLMSSNQIPLKWTGADIGSGIRYYNIYYSKDGDPYLMAAPKVRDSSFVFEGDPDAEYRFYSVAYDSAGNREPIPLMADAVTRTPKALQNDPLLSGPEFKLYPNPNDGNFHVEIRNPGSNQVRLSVTNLVGQILYQETIQTTGLKTLHSIQLPLATGMYQVWIQRGQEKICRKLVIH